MIKEQVMFKKEPVTWSNKERVYQKMQAERFIPLTLKTKARQNPPTNQPDTTPSTQRPGTAAKRPPSDDLRGSVCYHPREADRVITHEGTL